MYVSADLHVTELSLPDPPRRPLNLSSSCVFLTIIAVSRHIPVHTINNRRRNGFTTYVVEHPRSKLLFLDSDARVFANPLVIGLLVG